ncbi:CCA tRNA nucleotidyltransferase [Mesobacillus zeae]|uniref:CCA-adding enzyme n=1 Tax=Mesobacillus zeae TaxID=1917180 RepID=A0A398B0X4_9BACI|nr:CCA tRNA nucleotidyltransferase [Mesobacillus zeae]RID82558.1 CCA tRNA nucleotidyltransferase [Mesobacillus zeae]
MNNPFLKAVPLLEKIESSGFEAYFVGGSVRDTLLGREITDVDIATSAHPYELKAIFPKTADIGIEHGTIMVFFEGEPYEITTFRSETGYSDHRRPDKVNFIRSLREDLKRRDFTMNAMAMDRAGTIIDPFNGQQALSQKLIVTVGNPKERFGEDALRMLRGIRFVGQLGFTLEAGTLASLAELGPLLGKIATERKTAEFEKILKGPFRSEALTLLAKTGISRYLPGLAGYENSLLKLSRHTKASLSMEEIWVLLLRIIGKRDKDAEAFLREWKLPSRTIKTLLKVLRWLEFRLEHKWDQASIYQAGKEYALAAENVYESLTENNGEQGSIADIFEKLPIHNLTELAVSGGDLLAWSGKGPGPWVKDVLEKAEMQVIDGKLDNEKGKIREWLEHCNLI